MTPKNKTPEIGVTSDIIRKVHLTLSDLKTGEEVLGFLKTTEPVFMDEVHRFIQTEISRMKFQLSEPQALHIGSIIGATYIAGFLIAREADHKIYNGLLPFEMPIKTRLTTEEIDRIIDKERDNGKSYKEIAKLIKNMLAPKVEKKSVKKEKKDTGRGKRLDLGDLS